MAYFEDFSELIAPDRRSAARSLYDVLATVEGMVDPDLFLARLRAQGLLDDAAARRYRSDETIELTVARPNKKSSSDTTVVLQQSAGSTVQVAAPPQVPTLASRSRALVWLPLRLIAQRPSIAS